jgi:hypothetical protein
LQFDNSPAALRSGIFCLTENERCARPAPGDKIVGAMKDLGTVPVMAYSLPGVRAFYPDGAWWTPCLMECSDQLLQQAETMGIDASFCPVRAMLPAFENGEHFPRPDLLVCSTGAVCDDFSAIAQRLEHLGHSILWWEIPRRRHPAGETACALPGQPDRAENPGGLRARRIAARGQGAGRTGRQNFGQRLPGRRHSRGQSSSPAAGDSLRRRRLFRARRPLPALEMLVAEMLAIHFCSDREETIAVLDDLLAEVQSRDRGNQSVISADAARIFWVNPVADLRAMNLLEELGGRICGSDYMFTHALDLIPENLPPLEALARTALADPMVGPSADRAARIVRECRASHAEAVVVSRIPGASHCAREGRNHPRNCAAQIGIPAIELEIPPVCDAMLPSLGSRLQALWSKPPKPEWRPA